MLNSMMSMLNINGEKVNKCIIKNKEKETKRGNKLAFRLQGSIILTLIDHS